MTLSFACGMFSKPTAAATTTNDVTCTDGTTGLAFDPKAVILFAGLTTTTGSSVADGDFSIGLSDGTNEYSAAIYMRDAATTLANQRRWSATKALTMLKTGSATDSECDVTMGTGKFTCSWTTNSATAYKVGWIALGGSDIKNAAVGTFTAGSAITGLGFQPDMVFVISAVTTAATTTNNAAISIGVAAQSPGVPTVYAVNARGYGAAADNKAFGTGQTTRAGADTQFINLLRVGGATLDYATATVVTTDSLGMTWTASPPAVLLGYLAVRGGSFYVNRLVSSGSGGSHAVTAPNFKPRGVMFGWNQQSSDNAAFISDHAGIGVGAMDSTSQVAFTAVNVDAVPFTGTCTGATAGPPGTLTDTAVTWPENGLFGTVTVTDPLDVRGPFTGTASTNTTTVLTLTGAWTGGTPISGDTYTIGSSRAKQRNETSNAIVQLAASDYTTPAALKGLAGFTSFDTGGFTVNFSTDDALLYDRQWYLVCGDRIRLPKALNVNQSVNRAGTF